MLTKTLAIVLHAVKYGESRLIVDMFTRTHGRLSFIVSIPKSAKAKLKKQYFQPLTILEVEADIRPQLQLQKLREARLAVTTISIASDPGKLAIGFFVAEFLFHTLRYPGEDAGVFDYVEGAVRWLEERQEGFANFHLVLLIRLSGWLGCRPNLEGYREGCYFDLREGTFVEQPPLHRDFLMPEDAGKMGLVMRMDFATMHLFRMSHNERNQLLEVILRYYRIHLPGLPELKSVEVLMAVFGE